MYSQLKDFVDVKHVKAHQDEKLNFVNLSNASKLNVLMDRFAALALKTKTAVKHKTVIPHLRKQIVSFRTPYERLTRNVVTEINRAKLGHVAEAYLRERWSFSGNAMRDVHWNELGTVINSVPFYKKVQYSRILHKQWPTMKRNHAWGYSTTDKCPLCMRYVEDRQHVLTCKDPIAQAHRDKLLLGLRTDLYKLQTSAFIVNHMIRILREYHSGNEVQTLTVDDVDR